MIRYSRLCDNALATTTLDPSVVWSIGTTISRDSEDDRLPEVSAHDFQGLLNTVDEMFNSIASRAVIASRKQRPTSHGSLKLLRVECFFLVSPLPNHILATEARAIDGIIGSCHGNLW